VIASADLGSIGVKHAGGKDFEGRITDATHRIVSQMPSVFEMMGQWKQIVLSPARQLNFTTQAAEFEPNASILPSLSMDPNPNEVSEPELLRGVMLS
jgi:hypothetical protein